MCEEEIMLLSESTPTVGCVLEYGWSQSTYHIGKDTKPDPKWAPGSDEVSSNFGLENLDLARQHNEKAI
jgi:hypothetical protein